MNRFCKDRLEKMLAAKWHRPLVLLVILVQVLVMAGVYVTAHMPLWTGEEILLNTRPVDPRSLFRGNYARLTYDISQIPCGDIHDALGKRPRPNEKIYVRLERGENGIYHYGGVSVTRPQQGIFLRSRLPQGGSRIDDVCRVRYGLEAFFAPKEKARQIEIHLRKSAVARIYVGPGGRGALKSVEKKEK